MLYQSGTLCAESRAERNFARSTVNAALRSFENKTTRLVAAIIGQLQPQTAAHCAIEQLLELISTHPHLAPETATLQRYCAAFPELDATTERQQARALAQARQRLHEALWPRHTARRFANAKGCRAA